MVNERVDDVPVARMLGIRNSVSRRSAKFSWQSDRYDRPEPPANRQEDYDVTRWTLRVERLRDCGEPIAANIAPLR